MARKRLNRSKDTRRAREVKELMTTLVIPLAIIGLVISLLIKKDNKSEEPSFVGSETISSSFYNNSNKPTKIRYKYILSHEMSSTDILKDSDLSEPLFLIESNDEILNESYVSTDEVGKSLPTVSELVNVNPGESIEKEFAINYRKDIDDEIKYNIRFEVKIVTEELIKGKWTPVYQVIFMERGPYWSLDKGPVERLIKDEEEVDYED